MRITFLQLSLLIITAGITTAHVARAQAALELKVSVEEKSISLENLFINLEKRYNVNFVYSPALIEAGRKVSLSVSDETLDHVLSSLLSPLNLAYTSSGNVVVIKSGGVTVEKIASVTVTGKVTDKNGDPLPGVTVRVKGGTQSAVTNGNGIYSITVADASAVLAYSFIGYQTVEQPVGNKTIWNIILTETDNKLNEIVVVGYGTQKRTDVTGAVTSANLEDFRNAPNTNIAQSLQGAVPGLNVGQVTSAGSTPSISIRGTNTISGNSSVLIVLDGIQYNGSFESINPDDIATIDVLKDASSTAVYGAQAANGVLLITSRKGKKNQQPRISFSSSYATQTPTVNLRPLDRQAYIDHVRDLYYNEAYLAPGYTQVNPAFNVATRVDASMKDASGNILSNDFDWYKAATHTGNIADNQLSVSGGSEKISYLISGAMTNQEDFIINDNFKRKSLRVNLETQATDWLKLGIQSFGSFVNKDGAEPNFSTILQMSPLNVPYDANGALIPFPFNTNFLNPFVNYDVDDYERHNYFFANIYSEIKIPFIKGLTYRINYGNNYRINQHDVASKYGAGLTGSASKDFESYYDYTLDNIVTYNRNFKKHDLTATLLYGSIQRQDNYTLANASGFTRLNLGYNSLEQGTLQFANSDAWSEALEYQMARVNYKYDDRYLLTATIRRDGFSGFAANHKYGYFPSVALGWVVTQEPFFKPSWVEFLKVRAGYGISGNQTSRYNSLSRLSSGPSYVFGDGGTTVFGQQVQSLANPDLRWERTAGLNAGLDFTLFKGRLSGSFDYYHTLTNDLLFSVALPVITGFGSINTNVGELQNQGTELSLTSKNIDTHDFKWSTTLNFARNTNKILKLVGLDANHDGIEDDLVASNLFIGKSISSIYNYQANGIYQIGETIPAGYSAGTYRVVDQNGDGAITTADQVILGSQDPAYRLSMLNSFQYKGFSFSFFFNSIQGGKNGYLGANSPVLTRDDNSLRYNYLSGIDYWSPTNPNGKYPRSIITGAIVPVVYQDRSFVRLQDVSLSYKFTGSFIKKLNLQNLSVYVSGKNLKTWTKWEGWDPETNQGLTINGRPVMKGYSFGVNLTF